MNGEKTLHSSESMGGSDAANAAKKDLSAIEIVKHALFFPDSAWTSLYSADLGKRKLRRILIYMVRGIPRQSKDRLYRSNRPKVNNLWDM